MLDQLPDDPAAKAGLGFASLGFIAMALRVWRAFSMEKTDTAKDRAEQQVYQLLKDEVARHDDEIKGLKRQISVFYWHHRETQTVAVDIYSEASINVNCQHCKAVKVLAQKIIQNDPPQELAEVH